MERPGHGRTDHPPRGGTDGAEEAQKGHGGRGSETSHTTGNVPSQTGFWRVSRSFPERAFRQREQQVQKHGA